MIPEYLLLPSITCPRCGRTSYHRVDVREGYCGSCHAWTTPRPFLRPVVGPASQPKETP